MEKARLFKAPQKVSSGLGRSAAAGKKAVALRSIARAPENVHFAAVILALTYSLAPFFISDGLSTNIS